MATPLSMDLRARIAAALSDGMTTRAAAKRFAVSVASAVRIGQKARSGRGLAPARMGGYVKPVLTGAGADYLKARLAEKPDMTVRALAVELREIGIAVSHDSVWRFLRRSGLSIKKNAAGG